MLTHNHIWLLLFISFICDEHWTIRDLVERFRARLRSSIPRSSLVKFERLLINSCSTKILIEFTNILYDENIWHIWYWKKDLGLIDRWRRWSLLHVPQKVVQGNCCPFLLTYIISLCMQHTWYLSNSVHHCTKVKFFHAKKFCPQCKFLQRQRSLQYKWKYKVHFILI